MKRIETNISEHRFLCRLENLCRKKVRFDKGYEDKDVFVVKRKGSKFCLLKHYQTVGRSDGYATDCLWCKYGIDECGHVFVDYRFGKMIVWLILSIICFAVGLPLWISVSYDAIVYGNPDWFGIAVAAFFWIFGLGGMLLRSKKERKGLEEHLLRICNGED